MRSINLIIHGNFTQCSTLHNCNVLISSWHIAVYTLLCSHFLVSNCQSTFSHSAPWNNSLKKTVATLFFALLTHALFFCVAAGETRGWGLLSPLLIVQLSVYYFVICCFFKCYLQQGGAAVQGEAWGRWVGWKLVGQFIILFLPCQVKTQDCSSLSQRAVITIGKQSSHF